MTGPSRRQRDEEFLATLTPPGGIHRTGGGTAAAGSQAADRAFRTTWWPSSAPGSDGSEWLDAGQEQGWEPVSPSSGGGIQLVAYQPAASPSPASGKRPVAGGKGGAAAPKQANSPRTAAQPQRGEASRKPTPVTPAYPGAPPLGAMTLNEFLGPLKTGPATPKLSFLDDIKAFVRQSKQVAAQPVPADARYPRRTQSQRSVVPAKRANSGSSGQKSTPPQGSGGSHGPVQGGSNTPAGQTLLRVLRGLPPEEPESPYAAVGKAFREAAKLPSVRFGESYGPPDDLQDKTQKQAREQEAIRALRGERPAREGTYDTIGKAFVAERKLPWQQRRAIEKARSGQPLTLAEQRLVERGREQVAAEIGLPFTAHELRRRALFGPGSINPRTLKPAAPPSGDELLQDNFEHTFTPNERSATEQSYETYRDKAARGELTPPPTFSENPQFRALQEQDLQRVRAWVAQNHFGISSIAAEKDLSNPAVQRELAAQLASKDPRTRYTDLAAQKHRYLAQLDFLASPDAAQRLGLKTQFGKQLLRAIVDERRTHLPTLKTEVEKGAGDVKVAAGAMALGFLAEALVAEGIASAPALLQMLGPTARAVPPTVGGAVEGGVQQAGTAFVGGERRPGELLKSLGIGGSLGALGGFLFGQLPAGELSTVERAQAVRTLEQASGKLEGVLRSAPAFSRESREALAELRMIRAKLAQVQELGHVQIPRKQSRPGSPVEPTPGTRRGGVNPSHSPRHDPVPSGPEPARLQAPVEPPAPATAAKEPLPAGTGAAHARVGEPHGGAQGPHVVQQSPTPEPVRVHVDPEGRFHVEGHGPVDAEDAATLAALDDAHRRGGAEARSRVLEALPPERRSRVEGLAQELEQRGALRDVVQAQRDHVAARRGAGAETSPPGTVAPTEPEPASPRGARETPDPTTGEDTGSVRVTEAEGPAGSDPGAVRPGAEDGARASSGEAHPPEGARAAAEAELDAATSAWHDRHGGKSHGPKPKPEVVEDALNVGRALVNAGARTKRELLQGLKQQLGPGHAEDFYQTVAGALERDTWSGGGRGGGSRPGVGGSGAENGGAAVPSLPAAAGGSTPVPLGSRATSEGSSPGSLSGGEPNPAPGTPGVPAAVAEGNPTVTPTGSASGSVPAATAGGSTSARAPGYGQGNRVFTPERADAARARLAPVLPNLRGGRPVEQFKRVREELRELGSFHYEAGARQVETWKARLEAEIGADTLSSAQLNELWVKTKTSATKALNEAARDGTSLPPRSTLSGSVPSTAPEFSAGAVAVSVPAEAARVPVPQEKGALREDLLAHLQGGLTPEQLRTRLRAQGHDLQAATRELRALQQEGHVYTDGQGASRVYRATPTGKPGEAVPPGKVTPEARRALVRQARAATDPVELWDRLRQLGIEDPTDPQSREVLERLGLRKHVEGWLDAPALGDLQSSGDATPRYLSSRGPIHTVLLNLPPDQRKLWTDPEALSKTLLDLYQTFDVTNPEKSKELVELVDGAMMAGLRALSLERMRLKDVNLEFLDRGVAGVLRANGELRVDVDYLFDTIVNRKCPGAVWNTWIHEIIHGRLPQKGVLPGEVAELRLYQGYEDGFSETFSRYVTLEQARMTILADSYNYYVQAYEMLVRAAGIDKRDLLRKLYFCQPGTIRSEFPRILGELKGRQYTPKESDAIRRVADQLFQKSHQKRSPNWRTAWESYRQWRKVLR